VSHWHDQRKKTTTITTVRTMAATIEIEGGTEVGGKSVMTTSLQRLAANIVVDTLTRKRGENTL
jgi:hypothetical protein